MTQLPPLHASQLEQDIIALLAPLKNSLYQKLSTAPEKEVSADVWTADITKRLCELGKDMKYSPRPSWNKGEWLFDICWRIEDQQGLLSLPLAVECELDGSFRCMDAQLDDLEKLIVARADLRLFIFRATDSVDANARCDAFKTLVQRHKQGLRGDRYLFAARNEAIDGFEYEVYIRT